MVNTITTSGACMVMAGKEVQDARKFYASGDDALSWDVAIPAAEAEVSSACQIDWVSKWSGLSANVSGILKKAVTALAAIDAIQSNIEAFNTITEAEDKINTLRDIALRNISLLRDKKISDFIQSPTGAD